MRRYSRQNDRPARVWQDIARNFSVAAATTSTYTSLLAFEAPAAGTLTGAPPEDITLLRIVGDFTVSMGAGGNVTVGLMMVDPGWTPAVVASSGFQTDSDKRILWHQTYATTALAASYAGFTAATWAPPGYLYVDGTADTVTMCAREAVHLDITPKVKLEQGKALILVMWENSDGATTTVVSSDMRVLYQRSRRR